MFDKGSVASLEKVAIWGEFTAASGRFCEKIYSVSVDELVSVAYRTSNEYWYMQRLPSSSGPLGPLPLVSVRRRMAVRYSRRTAVLGQ